MKIKDGYMLKKVADSFVALSIGAETDGRVIRMNSTGAFIWEILKNDTDTETVTKALVERYQIDEITAEKAATDFIEKLRKEDILA